jgi:hypothetical protein
MTQKLFNHEEHEDHEVHSESIPLFLLRELRGGIQLRLAAADLLVDRAGGTWQTKC